MSTFTLSQNPYNGICLLRQKRLSGGDAGFSSLPAFRPVTLSALPRALTYADGASGRRGAWPSLFMNVFVILGSLRVDTPDAVRGLRD